MGQWKSLTKILREKGTMNGMITVNENYDLDTNKMGQWKFNLV